MPLKTKSNPKPNNALDILLEETFKRLEEKTNPITMMPNDPVGWIEQFFWIPRDEDESMRLTFAPYQKFVLKEAFTRDERGLYRYSTIVWSDLKKTFKSVCAAAVILWKAYHSEWGRLYIIGNDLKQADNRVAHYLRRAIQLHPQLSRECEIRPSGYTITFPNHTIVECVPIDPSGESGSNADFISWTEAWGLISSAHVRMFDEMALPPAKIGKAMRWAESYAGFTGESLVLEQLYETGVVQGRRIHDDYEVYVNESARMLTLWNTKPRLKWHTEEHLASEAKVLTPENYSRFYENAWASSSDTFVPIQWWDSCQGEVPPITQREYFVGAIDAAVSQDSTALVVVSCVSGSPLVYVRHTRVWYPPKGGKIDLGEVEAEVRRVAKEFPIMEFTYDPMHIEYMVANLMNDGIYCHSMNQGGERLKSDMALYEAIRDRLIRHQGEPELRDHIQNSSKKVNTTEGIRIVKTSESKKIDLTVALSMAAWTMKFTYNTN